MWGKREVQRGNKEEGRRGGGGNVGENGRGEEKRKREGKKQEELREEGKDAKSGKRWGRCNWEGSQSIQRFSCLLPCKERRSPL